MQRMHGGGKTPAHAYAYAKSMHTCMGESKLAELTILAAAR